MAMPLGAYFRHCSRFSLRGKLTGVDFGRNYFWAAADADDTQFILLGRDIYFYLFGSGRRLFT